MNPHDPEADDPVLDAALSQLPRTLTPSEGYTDRVLGAMRERELRQAPARVPRMLIAAAWFLAGVGTGAAVLSVLRNEPVDRTPVLTASRGSDTFIPAEPVEWY